MLSASLNKTFPVPCSCIHRVANTIRITNIRRRTQLFIPDYKAYRPKRANNIGHLFVAANRYTSSIGGIAPNQVIARSEFEVNRQIYNE